jgi:formate dehydrogenase assembly factor FdhD
MTLCGILPYEADDSSRGFCRAEGFVTFIAYVHSISGRNNSVFLSASTSLGSQNSTLSRPQSSTSTDTYVCARSALWHSLAMGVNFQATRDFKNEPEDTLQNETYLDLTTTDPVQRTLMHRFVRATFIAPMSRVAQKNPLLLEF